MKCTYRGYDIVSLPPPSSGGLIICEILNILEGYPIGYLGLRLGGDGAPDRRGDAACVRRSQRPRSAIPTSSTTRSTKLTSKAYAEQIRAQIDPYRAGVSADLMPAGFGEHKETTHFSIVDKDGNAVAITYTLNGVVRDRRSPTGTGILLNNEMDDFTTKPGVPNRLRARAGRGERDRAGQAPLSSMTPTIVSRTASRSW